MGWSTFPHVELIFLISLIWASTATAIYGAVDLGDSCFSMSSMSSVLWIRLDTGDLGDENATVVTADGHSCILPNRKIIKGSWGSEVVFKVSPDWQCHLPGDDIELKAKKGGGFISCHEEMQKAEAEVEVMVSYYNHVVATHAALFTTSTSVFTSTPTTTTTTVPPISIQNSIAHTTSRSGTVSHNVSGYDKGSDYPLENTSSTFSSKHINFQINQDLINDRKKKGNKHLRRKIKTHKRKGKKDKDFGKVNSETESGASQKEHNSNFQSIDYSQVTPDASLYTNPRPERVHIHTTEKSSSWQFDSANPYRDDYFFSDSADDKNQERKPLESINDSNMKHPDVELLPSTVKGRSQDLSLFQFENGMSFSINELIIIGAGIIIGIGLLISAVILIMVLKRKKREVPVDYWV